MAAPAAVARSRSARGIGLLAAGALSWLALCEGVPLAQGQKVAVVAAIPITSLNPVADGRVLLNPMIFDGLTRLDDGSNDPKPALAESWTASPDGLEYVFKLRRGVVFHDGSPFTAEDARFSLEVVCHRDNVRMGDVYARTHAQIRGCPDYRAGRADRVEGVEVLDSHTLRVRLSEPSPVFLVGAATRGVVPRARYQGIPVKDLAQHAISRAPVGTGPFAFVEWREGERVVLRANPRYFLGRPKLDGIVIRFIEDPATRLLEYKQGGLHFGLNIPVSPQEHAAVAGDSRLTLKGYRGLWHRFLALDLTSPLFTDVRVRRALSHAFDRERILKDALYDRGRIVNGPLDPALPEFARTAVPEYDPALAKRLLAEAGWQPGPDGVLQKEGRRFEFSLLSHTGASAALAVVYHDYLKRIGMDARIETLDFPAVWSRYRPGQFQAASMEMVIGYGPDPAYNLGYFQCGVSRYGYCNREVDALIARARTAIDSAERVRAYRQLQEILARDLPVIWIANPDDLRLASSRLVLPDRRSDFYVTMAVREWDLRD
jgi:peptide/nickel transport system substrate-binding protein